MRPIEYRFYHKYENKMYYNVGFTMIGVQSYFDDNVPEVKILDTGINNGYLLEFTGLYDLKGVKIFESDIVENEALLGVVIFENGLFTLDKSLEDRFGIKQPLSVHKNLKVIGNIYEHPNLLEQK